jgi:lysosomal acid lipase/cholesteryl ester hydrolase
MHYLFGWSCKNISPERRAHLFQYIYSPSSIVLVRHWFQIIRSGRLEGFDGRRYDLSGIKCPVAIIAGEEDKLIVPETLRDTVSQCVLFHIEPGYEHLDLLWADNSSLKIFPLVLEVIAKFG